MPYCIVCAAPVEVKGSVCSLKCRRELASAEKRKMYRKEKGKRWERVNLKVCIKCGLRLHHPGRFCERCKVVIRAAPLGWKCLVCGKDLKKQGRVCSGCSPYWRSSQ